MGLKGFWKYLESRDMLEAWSVRKTNRDIKYLFVDYNIYFHCVNRRAERGEENENRKKRKHDGGDGDDDELFDDPDRRAVFEECRDYEDFEKKMIRQCETMRDDLIATACHDVNLIVSLDGRPPSGKFPTQRARRSCALRQVEREAVRAAEQRCADEADIPIAVQCELDEHQRSACTSPFASTMIHLDLFFRKKYFSRDCPAETYLQNFSTITVLGTHIPGEGEYKIARLIGNAREYGGLRERLLAAHAAGEPTDILVLTEDSDLILYLYIVWLRDLEKKINIYILRRTSFRALSIETFHRTFFNHSPGGLFNGLDEREKNEIRCKNLIFALNVLGCDYIPQLRGIPGNDKNYGYILSFVESCKGRKMFTDLAVMLCFLRGFKVVKQSVPKKKMTFAERDKCIRLYFKQLIWLVMYYTGENVPFCDDRLLADTTSLDPEHVTPFTHDQFIEILESWNAETLRELCVIECVDLMPTTKQNKNNSCSPVTTTPIVTYGEQGLEEHVRYKMIDIWYLYNILCESVGLEDFTCLSVIPHEPQITFIKNNIFPRCHHVENLTTEIMNPLVLTFRYADETAKREWIETMLKFSTILHLLGTYYPKI